MILTIGSILLACIQLASTYLLTRKNRRGWLLSITANIVALPYDTITGQYGFLPVCGLNLAMACRAWIAWGRDD